MVNSTAQNFINFQSQVGKAQSKTKLWGAYIVSFVLIFIGIISLYHWVKVTMSPSFCDTNCYPPDKNNSKKCEELKCKDKTPKRVYLMFGLSIPIAIFVIFIARYNDNLVQTNQAYAAFQGTEAEIGGGVNLLKKIF
jgi:hypothetical protein